MICFLSFDIDAVMINSLMMKIAEFYKSHDTNNKLRAHLLKEVIAKNHSVLEQHVYNKEEFTNRLAHLLQSNDAQSRIISLQVFSWLPSFLCNRLDIQHKILLILTTTSDPQERMVANQTISKLSKGSEVFAQSILNKVEEVVGSGQFSLETSLCFIRALPFVSTHFENAKFILKTVESLFSKIDEIYGTKLDSDLMLSLIEVTYKAPLILFDTVKFLLEIDCFEGIELLSRKFPLHSSHIKSLLKALQQRDSLERKDHMNILLIIVNQRFLKCLSQDDQQAWEKQLQIEYGQMDDDQKVEHVLLLLNTFQRMSELLLNQIYFLLAYQIEYQNRDLLFALNYKELSQLYVSFSEYGINKARQVVRNISKAKLPRHLSSFIDAIQQEFVINGEIDSRDFDEIFAINVKLVFYEIVRQNLTEDQIHKKILLLARMLMTEESNTENYILLIKNLFNLVKTLPQTFIIEFLQELTQNREGLEILETHFIRIFFRKKLDLSLMLLTLENLIKNFSNESTFSLEYCNLVKDFIKLLIELQNFMMRKEDQFLYTFYPIKNKQSILKAKIFYHELLCSITTLLLKFQSFTFKAAGVMSQYDIQGKDILEARDPVQGDSTSEPYRFIFIYQWLAIVEGIVQLEDLKLTMSQLKAQEGEESQAIEEEFNQMKLQHLKDLNSQIRNLEKIQGFDLIEKLDIVQFEERLSTLVFELIEELFYLMPPPYIIISPILTQEMFQPKNQQQRQMIMIQDEIQVQKDHDFLLEVKLQLSNCSSKVKQKLTLCKLDWTIILNHASHFNIKSSEVISQNRKVISLKQESGQSSEMDSDLESDSSTVYHINQRGQQPEKSMKSQNQYGQKNLGKFAGSKEHEVQLLLRFPTVGQYLLRLEATLINILKNFQIQ